jgi:nucleoside 2-deoxyribosyltransferase
MCTYYTPTQERELAIIGKTFPTHEIVDPGDYEDNLEKEVRGMEYCLELVESCDALVFSRILGKVTAGVGKEVEHAFSLGKPVYELVGDRARMIYKSPKYVSKEETKDLYAEWKHRSL